LDNKLSYIYSLNFPSRQYYNWWR